MTDRAYWDSQFKFAEILPDFLDYGTWMDEATAHLAKDVAWTRHETGGDPRQFYEITGEGAASTVVPVYLHGGFWRAVAMTAERHRFVACGLQRLGETVINVEYRLLPDVRMADLLTDVATSLRHAASRLQDHQKFVLVGHSAGAHIALEMMEHDDIAACTAGIIAVSGIYDLDPCSQSFLQEEVHFTDHEVGRFSPLSRTLHLSVPTVMVVGAEETDAFIEQSELMADKLGTTTIQVRGSHHLAILGSLADPATPLMVTLEAWLKGRPPLEEVDGRLKEDFVFA